jgi:hypothetical protein
MGICIPYEPVGRRNDDPVIDAGSGLEMRQVIPVVEWVPVTIKIEVRDVVSKGIEARWWMNDKTDE